MRHPWSRQYPSEQHEPHVRFRFHRVLEESRLSYQGRSPPEEMSRIVLGECGGGVRLAEHVLSIKSKHVAVVLWLKARNTHYPRCIQVVASAFPLTLPNVANFREEESTGSSVRPYSRALSRVLCWACESSIRQERRLQRPGNRRS